VAQGENRLAHFETEQKLETYKLFRWLRCIIDGYWSGSI